MKNKIKIPKEQQIHIIHENTNSILRTLEHFGVSATFFIEESLVESLETLITKINENRHEIGLYSSSFDKNSIGKAKNFIEKSISRPIKGFRDYKNHIDSKILAEHGFSYYSPTEEMRLDYIFRRLQQKSSMYIEENVQIIPESISPYSQIPYNESIFQFIPTKYYKNMLFETLKDSEYVLIYLNILQFTDFEKHNIGLSFIRKYNTGKKMEDKLSELMEWLNENDLATSTIKDFMM